MIEAYRIYSFYLFFIGVTRIF